MILDVGCCEKKRDDVGLDACRLRPMRWASPTSN